MTLSNRIVLSPMTMMSAVDGVPQNWHFQHYGGFSASGVGLVVLESTAIAPDGRIGLGCLGLYSDACEEGMGRLVSFIKSVGPAKVGVQLFYSGRKGSLPIAPPAPRQLTPEEGGWPTIAPSSIPFRPHWTPPRAADHADLARIRAAWVDAARRAVRAGFDAVELHSAQGYGLHPFLTPLNNFRDDEYGGDLNRRMRFPLEVIRGIRAALPPGMPLGMRISAVDGLEGGLTLDDSVAYVKAAMAEGLDYVCASSGGAVADFRLPQSAGYQVPFAETIRRETGVVARAGGLISDPWQAQEIISNGRADFIALGRALLNDPRWVFHAAEVLGHPISYPRQYDQLFLSRWPRDIVGTAGGFHSAPHRS